jgi:hypothetical protein
MGFRAWILLALPLLAFFAKMIFKSLPAIGVRARRACRAMIASQSPIGVLRKNRSIEAI